uniref:Protein DETOXIFICATION n=1 Tax=Solanum lycopersicum TaxID=4081 RepID=A0A3Q7FUQ3_SOLLC
MMPLLARSNFIDGLQCVLSGALFGWQKIGAIVNLGSYYFVGIPRAVLMAFVLHIGGKLGIICALLVQVLCLLFITLRANWEEEVSNSHNTMNAT